VLWWPRGAIFTASASDSNCGASVSSNVPRSCWCLEAPKVLNAILYTLPITKRGKTVRKWTKSALTIEAGHSIECITHASRAAPSRWAASHCSDTAPHSRMAARRDFCTSHNATLQIAHVKIMSTLELHLCAFLSCLLRPMKENVCLPTC